MDWKKLIGFGILIWIIMFGVVSIFIGFKIYDSSWMKVVTAIIAGTVSLILTANVKPRDIKTAITYGISWIIIGVILDALITMRFNAQIFLSKGLWLSYLLILLAPLVYVEIKKSGKAPQKSETLEPPPEAEK